MTDLQKITDDLHAARHKDARMADWARKYGVELLREIETLRRIPDLAYRYMRYREDGLLLEAALHEWKKSC